MNARSAERGVGATERLNPLARFVRNEGTWVRQPAVVRRTWERIRRAPTAYSRGALLFVIAAILLVASLHGEVGAIATGVAAGDAEPGNHEREVPFRTASLFQANLIVSSCGVDFYLLNDTAYAAYTQDGTLPTASLDCNRTAATIEDEVGHLVTLYPAPSSAPNVTYAISATFMGLRTPYAVLSVPGTAIALAATLWISLTMMTRGTERLATQVRDRKEGKEKK